MSPPSSPPSPPGRFHLGCAVWAHSGWVGRFYPHGTAQRDMLRRYAERLTAVEGNTTFYAVPTPDTVRRWAGVLPSGFRFAPKMPQAISHSGELERSIDAARVFVDDLSELGERLGPIFLQLPKGYGPGLIADLERFLAAWPDDAPPLLVEVRHPDWYRTADARRLHDLLTDHGVGRAVLDSRPVHEGDGDPQAGSTRRKPRLPVAPFATAATCIVRYIGHPDRARNPPYLTVWAERVERWLGEGRDVLFFCHCPREEHSPFIARDFQRLLVERGAPVPPLPWDDVDDVPRQRTMFS